MRLALSSFLSIPAAPRHQLYSGSRGLLRAVGSAHTTVQEGHSMTVHPTDPAPEQPANPADLPPNVVRFPRQPQADPVPDPSPIVANLARELAQALNIDPAALRPRPPAPIITEAAEAFLEIVKAGPSP